MYITAENCLLLIPNMQHSRYSYGVARFRSKIFTFGGFVTQTDYSDKAEALDLQSLQWESLPDMPQARTLHGTCTAASSIYLAGGWTAEAEDLGKLVKFDPFSYQYTEIPIDFGMPEKRTSCLLADTCSLYLLYFGNMVQVSLEDYEIMQKCKTDREFIKYSNTT